MYYRHKVLLTDYQQDLLEARIPIALCKPRSLYRVDTRNLGPVAIFSAEMNNGFYGIRRKFGWLLDAEYHYENGAPFGTANPWEELPETLPESIALQTTTPTQCKHCDVYVDWFSDATGLPAGPPPGKWYHLLPTACQDCHPVSRENKDLMSWLKEMELKYWWPINEKPDWLG